MAVPAPTLAATLGCGALLDIVEQGLHASRSEWLFLRELRAGTGYRNSSAQRLDAFALNTLPHTGMRRVCYEVKTSRSDFLSELRNPLKRRMGMRYSNEFYFLTPAGLVDSGEIPSECGLVEVSVAEPGEWKRLLRRSAGMFYFDPESRRYCMVSVLAPWRDTPGPSWQLVAAMLRNQRREWEEKPLAPPQQHRLRFE